ncbi:hypothetical protein N7495_009071 [Penicillium taxi]|uniref:uncharacterized protein n=1 Tax=Penicillium taxi TaxID=168475 RepID=UPI00254517BE|nr:uncharacterized protein N7495_009071 [Penicillium taxi]KAJ5889030.1 hypothetical protein N7495_009071 [Penicillium taxi]
MASIFFGLLLLPLVTAKAPYAEYILAPSSRDVTPESVRQVNGSVTNPEALTQSSGESTTFHGVSSVTYDFGKNVAGLVSVDIGASSSSSAFIGVTFTESSLWISHEACDSTANSGLDTPLWFPVGQGVGKYTPDLQYQRGAFRYLTLVSNTTATISVDSVHIIFTAAPTQDLQAYTGWFHSNDELINEIWYAGAYTSQLCTIDPRYGDSLVDLSLSSTANITLPQTEVWYSNYTIANGSSTITDGAKRDRLVWPGDMAISLEGIAVSTGDLYSVQMGLESLLVLQQADGELPWAGVPFKLPSYTYHLHSLIGVSYLYRFSGDKAWLSRYWGQYIRGIQWALSSVDSSGLANVTIGNDWLRAGMGGHNIEANSILYFVLQQAQNLAEDLGYTSHNSNWSAIAAKLKLAANTLLWDDAVGLYRDNETATLYPQDGNAWAIKANITSDAQINKVSSALKARWGTYGAPAPEAGITISPFIGGFELQAHYIAGEAQSALDLIRLQWGFMLNDPRMTHSTFIEGYSTDGSIHYAPYGTVDSRISHAHGWSTGPTFALTAYSAGIQLIGAGGSSWLIAPQPGDLTLVDSGLTTSRGVFSISYQRDSDGSYRELSFKTPSSTIGAVKLPGVNGILVSSTGQRIKFVNSVTGLRGGNWKLQLN